MRLPFLNRDKDINRLKTALNSKTFSFIVIYGRRRCGKSRLLQHISGKNDLYFLADQNVKQLQIESLSQEIAKYIKNFDQAIYPSWESLLSTLNERAIPGMCLILDEFPYLVQSSQELPSVIQKQIDLQKINFNLIICGSSQRMMQGIVLDTGAPLYGRADEIIKIRPMEVYWMAKALNLKSEEAIENYSVWGGVPRYWELAKNYHLIEDAVKELIFDRNGVLHNEPLRLLLDDMRTATQAHSLLSLIANGSHKISKISKQIGKPASSLTRPLANLIELGYVKREIPFGESLRSTKRTLYKLEDPFLMFWYKFIHPNQSILEMDTIDGVYEHCQSVFHMHVASIWEELARKSIVYLNIENKKWKPGSRWWGRGIDGKEMEIDVVSESFDKEQLLIGEVKWENNSDINRINNKLLYYSENFPKKNNQKIVLACWVKKRQLKKHKIKHIFTPQKVLNEAHSQKIGNQK
ncbi:ATP-binding protein [Candidatus Magnetomorum sp. HK-1]|nr:ATP-binding protein [Candidatus Magnetomorum sp. HK-1]